MRERELEVESDHRDKQREMEEIDEILRKRLAEPPIEKENEVMILVICIYSIYIVTPVHTRVRTQAQTLARTHARTHALAITLTKAYILKPKFT